MTVNWVSEGGVIYAEAGGKNWKGVPVWNPEKRWPSVNEHELYVKTGETPEGDWEFRRIDTARTFSFENLSRRVLLEIELARARKGA